MLRTTTVGLFLALSTGSLLCGCSDDGASDPAGDGDSNTSSSTSGGANMGGETGASGGSESSTGGQGATDGTGGTESPGPTSTPRPQLSEEEAAEHTALAYLGSRGSVVNLTEDGWDPTDGLPPITDFTADYTVAAEGGTHTTVQEAVEAALAGGGEARVYIAVEPGTYRELVCINSSTPPLTLYGTGSDPSETRVVYDNYNGKTKGEDEAGQPCSPSLGNTTYGTSGSSTFAVTASGFQAKNLTIENDTDESTASGGLQAVALMTTGDQIILDEVHLRGNQDTFYVKGVNPALAVRVYVEDSVIAGDTDFIFGHARLVIENSTIHVVGDRRSDGVILAPSTHALNPHGFLIQNSIISADESVTVVRLGRAWDEGQGELSNYLDNVDSGDYPNGTAVIRNTDIQAPVADAAWSAAATTGRPFSSVETEAPANRLYEFENTGPGSVGN